ncbi:MAG TPA: FHA domain-containing protein [Candidatus Limiplasma sp.]|nr:FHA domain-containing protein [Candidatus Limiplasma sp.]
MSRSPSPAKSVVAAAAAAPVALAAVSVVVVAAAAAVTVAAIAAVGVMVWRQMRGGKTARKASGKTSGRVLVSADGKRYPLGHKLSIGRDPKRCKLALPKETPGVSALHCTLRFDGTRVTVTDENSTYGTYIDDVKLTGGKPTVMHRGQTLYLGNKHNAYTLHS